MVHRADTDTMTRKGGSIKGRLTEVVHIIHRVPADIITVDGIHPPQVMARLHGRGLT
jgi:hypothetical protein